MRSLLLLVAVALLTVSCDQDGMVARLESPQAKQSSAFQAVLHNVPPDQPDEADEPLAIPWAHQKLIRNGDLSVRVERSDEATDSVRNIAAEHGGFIADSRMVQAEDGNRRVELVLRIPAARFDAAIADLRLIVGIESESVTTEDVTKAYADLETRLRVLRRTEERLHALLRENTGSLSDVLEVERELGRVVERIEGHEGERRFYDTRIAVSRIRVSIYEQGTDESPPLWSPIAAAFSDSARVLAQSAGFAVYIVSFVIPWLILATLAWFVVSRLKRRGHETGS